ncbi:MAG: hypothetical protein HYZ28_21400 [Myxococcales bacterium]|nr:hypothetical protein [Myxococcales bacterium]
MIHEADGLCVRCYEDSPARAATYQRYRRTEGRRRSRKAWLERNQETAARDSRWRTRLRRGAAYGVVDEFTPDVEEIVFDEFGRRCALCGATDRLCLDHHEPLQDRRSLIDNAVVLCLACNSAKGTTRPGDFYRSTVLKCIEGKLAWCRARRLAHESADTAAEAA